ncbi:MAG: sugar ABC transporter permease [Planctomycetota bacterium]|nr:sugar ABC transporter permease [Planctomycetota bacterium]
MTPRGRHLFFLPALVVLGLFVLVPAAQTLVGSFHRVGPDGASEYVGGLYYRYALTDGELHRAFLNNVSYFLLTIPCEVGAGLLLALALEGQGRGRALLRLCFFAPVALSMVVVGLVFGFLFKDGVGVFPGLLAEGKALLTISLVSGWAFAGVYMVIFLAGLSAIPREVEEAARLDGAGAWQVAWHVKLPLLRRTTGVALLLCFVGAFRAFDLFWVMLPNQEHTSVVATLLVREVLQFDDPGYGSALAVLLSGFVLGVLGLVQAVRGGRA